MNNIQKKAVALISGGLDSMLATKLILEQGIHVEGLNFYTGFCVEGHTHAIRRQDKDKKKRNNALWVAEQLGIKLHFVDVVEEYKNVVINPKHGYGANLNPCLDCKIFMVGKAKTWMEKYGFDFIITGEVIGQRPKSQHKIAMPIVARESGAEDKLLRPLCAKNLAPTLPEREGWVDRNKLANFSGRNRKPQIQMAATFGFKEYSQPAGGCCFLTNEQYSSKLSDLWAHRGTKEYELDDIMLLKVGRHIRPKPHFKLIVGREEGENNFLSGYRDRFTHLLPVNHRGPTVLVEGEADAMDLHLAASILARYCDTEGASNIAIKVGHVSGSEWELQVKPLLPEEVLPTWHV